MVKKIVHETKLPKWFMIYESVFVLVCVLCQFVFDANIFYECIVMGIFSVLSMGFVIMQFVVRWKVGQKEYMTNLFLMGVFTVIVMIWCMEGLV